MLQYPTNVYPQNIAVDLFPEGAEDNTVVLNFSFTFNGDKLTRMWQSFYDGETYKEIYTRYRNHNIPTYFNGETVSAFSLTYGQSKEYFKPNKDYMYNYIFGQTDDEGNNDYSIYIGRGKLIEDSTDNTVLHIKDKVSNIYGFTTATSRTPFYINNAVAFGMTITIGTETRVITNYDYNTGTLKVDSAFTGTLNKDTPYKMYSNYLITPYYYFRISSTPVISLNIDVDKGMIHCKGTYSQKENHSIKYYTISCFRYSTEELPFSNRITSDRIYSGRIEQYFPEFCPSTKYDAVLTVCSQDNFVKQASATFTTEKYELDFISNPIVRYIDKKGVVRVEWEVDKETYFNTFTDDSPQLPIMGAIYREDIETGETEYLNRIAVSSGYFNDCKIQNTKQYRYMIVPQKGNIITTDIIKIDDLEWIISEVDYDYIETTSGATHTYKYNPYNCMKICTARETWKFSTEVEDTTIVQNTDKTLHVGSAQYPLISHSDTQYMSGTLTAMLGHLDCATSGYADNIELLTAWRKFITRDTEYLLKSPKGDIWLVGITDNPSTSYDEKNIDKLTKFTFSWAELRSVDDYYFKAIVSDGDLQ